MTAGALVTRSRRLASWVLIAIALAVAAAASYIVFVPIDATNFASETGLDWTEFSTANPEASSYLAREARVLAVAYVALGLIAATLAWDVPRSRDRRAVVALLVFPVGLVATSLVFLIAGDALLGATYLAAAVVFAVALAIVGRERAFRDQG